MMLGSQTPGDDATFKARTTTLQFQALAARLDLSKLVAETAALPYRKSKCTRSSLYNPATVQSLLVNGWNTEVLLHQSRATFTGDGLRHALHWAFPQAYYSAFSVCLAFFKTVGYSEDGHASVIRKMGMCMNYGYYPATLAFRADGGKQRSYPHLSCCTLPWSTYFTNEPSIVDTHLRGFLNGTRDRDLRRHLLEQKPKTKQGKPKTKFSAAEYSAASAKIGPTSLLSLLYRKRIKANYQDIDTFLHPALDASEVYDGLAQCVWSLNFVHEAFICAAVGAHEIRRFVDALPAGTRPRFSARAEQILAL